MAIQEIALGSTDAAILARIVRPEEDGLSNEAAQALLQLQLDQSDLARLHELVVKNQADALSPTERPELESYLRINSFLDLMQAKARRTLKKQV